MSLRRCAFLFVSTHFMGLITQACVSRRTSSSIKITPALKLVHLFIQCVSFPAEQLAHRADKMQSPDSSDHLSSSTVSFCCIHASHSHLIKIIPLMVTVILSKQKNETS